MEEQSEIFLNNGISRAERLPESLDPANLKLDDRDFADLMNMASEFSSLFKYFNRENEHDGYWSELLLKEDLFIVCMIAKIDTLTFRKQFDSIVQTYFFVQDEDTKKRCQKYLLMIIIYMAKAFDTWYQHLSKDPSHRNIVFEIKDAVESKLSIAIQRIKTWENWTKARGIVNQEIIEAYQSLTGIWSVGEPDNDELVNPDSLDDFTGKMQEIFGDFYDTASYLKRAAPVYINASMEDGQKHNPHVALFIAFLKLLQHAQHEMNNITQRHLDFYYSNVLQQKRRKEQADSVFVAFELNEGFKPVLVPDGKGLVAGKDKTGKDVIYRTNENLIVSKAKIKNIKTVFVVRNEKKFIGAKTEKLVSKVNVALLGTDEIASGWPLIGDVKLLDKEKLPLIETQLGFVIAAGVLRTESGNRSYEVNIWFKDAHFDDYDYYISRNRGLDKIFNVYLSSVKGWLPVLEYRIQNFGDHITLKFDIGADKPPVCGSKVLGEQYNTTLPMLKVMLVPEQEKYPYSYLSGLKVFKVDIKTTVTGFSNVLLSNKYSKLDPAAPFEMFGPIPEKNDYLAIGSNEVFHKKLTNLSVHLKWAKLPEKGFADYYAGYNLGIDDNSFKVKLSALDNGDWVPAPIQRPVYQLFTTAVVSGQDKPQLSSITTFENIDLNLLGISKEKDCIATDTTLNNYTQDGFIKIELFEPEAAFGHAVYPHKLAEVAFKNNVPEINVDHNDGGTITYKTTDSTTKLPLPQTPFVPELSALTIDYEAIATIEGASITTGEHIFLTIDPEGIANQEPSAEGNWQMFRSLDDETGSMYIGFESFNAPETLALLIMLKDKATAKRKADAEVPYWSYLTDKGWVKFDVNRQLIADGTGGLAHSGIVKLEVPESVKPSDSMSPGGLCWIKVTVPVNTSYAGWAKGIHIHAVEANRVNEGNDFSNLINSLIPGSITKFEENTPAIKKINQPYYSFGSQGPESTSDYYSKVSERMRHKQRAVSSWDYERLVLERFSFVNKVVCFQSVCSGTNKENSKKPGSVVVVVTQFVKNKQQPDPLEIMVDAANTERICEYLSQYSSPFAQIEVRNPVFEKVQIDCRIRFVKGFNNGYYQNQLVEALNRYLCPWLYDETIEIRMGENLSRLDVLACIERLSYIDTIDYLALHFVDENNNIIVIHNEEERPEDKLIVQNYWSVIVPATQHKIEVI